jgi:hypothetical protein
MNQQNQSLGNQFVGLSDVTHTEKILSHREGNVLKDAAFSMVAFEELTSDCKKTEEPNVIVNRDGDRIINIEFRCSCGCSKTITFDYDDE